MSSTLQYDYNRRTGFWEPPLSIILQVLHTRRSYRRSLDRPYTIFYHVFEGNVTPLLSILQECYTDRGDRMNVRLRLFGKAIFFGYCKCEACRVNEASFFSRLYFSLI